MKLLHLFLALFTTTLFLACSSDKEQLQVETNLTTYSEDVVDLRASGAKAYSWRQISGTPVILINANSATPSFIAPDVVTEETLVFELEAVTVQIQGESMTLTKQVSVVVHPKATLEDSTDTDSTVEEVSDTDMHSTSGEVQREGTDTGSISPEEQEEVKEAVEQTSSPDTNTTLTKETNSTSGSTPSSSTQTSAALKSLKLTLEKTSLNVDTNITLKVIATYQDNTTKDVTNQVEWNLSDTNAAQITQKSLHAKRDTNIFIQAKLGTESSNTLALEIYWEVNGHTLPPMPDETLNNSTLLGIDTNNNGVRDDVERWIYTTYNTYIPCVNKEINVTLDNGTTIEAYEEVCEDKAVPYHQIVREIAMQGARAAQIIIQEPEKARETTHLMDAAQECNAYFQYSSGTQNQAVSINHDIISSKDFTAIQFNTVQRARAYAKYNFALSGGVYPSSKDERSECDFDVDKLLGK